MILAIDPGPHTGIFGWSEVYKVALTLDLEDVHGELGILQHRYLWDWLESHVSEDDTIVLEKFEYQKEKAKEREALNFDAAEYVGVVKLWCDMNNVKLILQSPSTVVSKDQKCFWDDDKLKRVGLWKGMDRHARDAARHYLYYVTFTLGDSTWLQKLRPSTQCSPTSK